MLPPEIRRFSATMMLSRPRAHNRPLVATFVHAHERLDPSSFLRCAFTPERPDPPSFG